MLSRILLVIVLVGVRSRKIDSTTDRCPTVRFPECSVGPLLEAAEDLDSQCLWPGRSLFACSTFGKRGLDEKIVLL